MLSLMSYNKIDIYCGTERVAGRARCDDMAGSIAAQVRQTAAFMSRRRAADAALLSHQLIDYRLENKVTIIQLKLGSCR